jgi:hypothetical protein
VEKTGKKRPWKSQERFPLSHSSNNNKLDDRDHFQQNAKTSVASLRGLIGSSRNLDRHQSGMLIAFIGIPRNVWNLPSLRKRAHEAPTARREKQEGQQHWIRRARRQKQQEPYDFGCQLAGELGL